MTSLLTADAAARLRSGEQLVIVRAGDSCGPPPREHSRLCAPQDWVALTGPCLTCDGKGTFTTASTRGRWETDQLPCPDCRDGRRIVPLYTECLSPYCDGKGGDKDQPGWRCPNFCNKARVLVGRGTIEVVPVGKPGDALPHLHWQPMASRWVLMGRDASITDTDFGHLDPNAAVPGRDWGILIDCVEV